MNVDAIEQNLPLCGVVQPAQQFDKRRFSASVFTDNRQLFTDTEFHGDVVQSILFTSRIPEGHIPKFNFILPVAPLLRCQTSLVHGVRDIQKVQNKVQIRYVVPHVSPHLDTVGNSAGQGRNRPDILGHIPHPERAAQRFQAHKQIDNPVKQPCHGLRRGLIRPHGASGIGCRLGFFRNQHIDYRRQLLPEKLLLGICADILGPLPLFKGNIIKKAEQTITVFYILADL